MTRFCERCGATGRLWSLAVAGHDGEPRLADYCGPCGWGRAEGPESPPDDVLAQVYLASEAVRAWLDAARWWAGRASRAPVPARQAIRGCVARALGRTTDLADVADERGGVRADGHLLLSAARRSDGAPLLELAIPPALWVWRG